MRNKERVKIISKDGSAKEIWGVARCSNSDPFFYVSTDRDIWWYPIDTIESRHMSYGGGEDLVRSLDTEEPE